MAPAPLLQENTAQGIQGGATSLYQVGVTDIDPGAIMERGFEVPWPNGPENSWLDYACWIESVLDPGIVVHRQMPQSAQDWDQLGTADPNSQDMLSKRGGPNLVSKAKFTDTVQRMAHSVYRFRLVGSGVRIGYQPTIPKLLEVGGVQAIPDGPQSVTGPRIISNIGGVPIYFASWSIPYTVAVPPTKNQTPPTDLALRVPAVDPSNLPAGIQVPFSQPDSKAVRSGPQTRIDLPTGLPRQGT